MSNSFYFRSSGYQSNALIKTESGNTLDLESLPAFLRTLLVMDGTVTKALESWFWEPIKVTPLSNYQEVNNENLQREVLLKGEQSKKFFAGARSTVVLDKLPKDSADALLKGKIGIGELLREQGLETYRELFNINYLTTLPKDDDLLNRLLLNDSNQEIVSRSYKIWVNKNPAITVTEYFPVQIYIDKI